MLKKIAVLTSGGDAPGMNPAIRAVTRTALDYDCEVIGISNGYQGIFEQETEQLTGRVLSGMIDRGGTILQSSRCRRFYDPAGIDEAKRTLESLGIEALVVIGGDGSLTGAMRLHERGFPTIGIPATIDNDMEGTDMAIGVDTAANTIMQLIDRIRDTARSHRRCFLIEVMGRHSGYLALTTAISCGAEVAVIPEFAHNMPRIVHMLHSRYQQTRDNSIIVLAEGVCDADTFISKMLQEKKEEPFDQEIRKTVLGHVQRGGVPTHYDRILGAQFGEVAVKALLQSQSGLMTAKQAGNIVTVPFESVIGYRKKPSEELISLARHLQIEFGDPEDPNN